MRIEFIRKVYITAGGELFLSLESGGKAAYQYVYREAAGVYWDQEKRGFKSTPIEDRSCAQWFVQIVGVVKSGLGVELSLAKDAVWLDVPDGDRNEILNQQPI